MNWFQTEGQKNDVLKVLDLDTTLPARKTRKEKENKVLSSDTILAKVIESRKATL